MKRDDKHIEEHIKKIVKPIFDGVPKETPKNQMSVGSVGKKIPKFCIYNLHNFRLYIDFDKSTLNIKKLGNPPPIRSVVPTYRLKNGTEHEIDNFLNCRVTVKKTQVEIQNKIESDKKHIIDITTEAHKKIRKIVNKKIDECIIILKAFIEIFGGTSKFKILNLYSENPITNEDIIDLLPIKMKWHTKLSKKVYNEKKVEFYDPALASNYIDARASEDVAPEIANSINNFGEKIHNQQEEWFRKYEKHLESHTNFVISSSKTMDKNFKIAEKTLKILNKIDNKLSQTRLNQFF